MKSLLERLLEAGYPKENIYHYCSDLYVFVTPLTTQIIDKYCEENKINKSWHFPIFKDQITGKKMYECIFQYYEINN